MEELEQVLVSWTVAPDAGLKETLTEASLKSTRKVVLGHSDFYLKLLTE